MEFIYANILDRDFYADIPDQKWSTDISYITEHKSCAEYNKISQEK